MAADERLIRRGGGIGQQAEEHDRQHEHQAAAGLADGDMTGPRQEDGERQHQIGRQRLARAHAKTLAAGVRGANARSSAAASAKALSTASTNPPGFVAKRAWRKMTWAPRSPSQTRRTMRRPRGVSAASFSSGSANGAVRAAAASRDINGGTERPRTISGNSPGGGARTCGSS